jgi:hypothetical protein
MFASGYHKLGFFFGLISIAVWAYILNEWGLWLILAILVAFPVGFLFALVGTMLVGTVRGIVGDVAATWIAIVVGIALVVWAVIALEGATLALVALTGGSLIFGGIGLFWMRLNAMRIRAERGEASQEDIEFLRSLER